MFSRNDFPDFMTESSYIRERHGPLPMTAEERAAWEAERLKTEKEILSAYDSGASIAVLKRSFPSMSVTRIRRIIATATYSRRFPDKRSEAQFFRELKERNCTRCFNEYLAGPFRSWSMGKRLTFPAPPGCPHRS